MKFQLKSLLLVLQVLQVLGLSAAWCSTMPPLQHPGNSLQTRRGSSPSSSSLGMMPPLPLPVGDNTALDIFSSCASLLSDAAVEGGAVTESGETWRQYVPLVVTGFVLVDIVLGNPVANKVLGGMRPPDEQNADKNARAAGSSTVDQDNQRKIARIDTEAFAQAALEKASNTLELRSYLENNKSDYDKMEDIKRKMDIEMDALDRKNRPSE